MENNNHKCPKCGKPMQSKSTRKTEKGKPTEDLTVWTCECGYINQPYKKSN